MTGCGPIDLVTACPRQLNWPQIGYGDRLAHEDAMTFKLPALHNVALLLAAGAMTAIGLGATQASTAALPTA